MRPTTERILWEGNKTHGIVDLIGAGKDALLMRQGLADGLKDARRHRCPLIVSRLDRLSRNVHFITGLMEHKVHFMVAALGRDSFTLHIYASLAGARKENDI
jgi:DNA invertase Pin-like site-specific DNA recombinase